jgi:hypothetical protein
LTELRFVHVAQRDHVLFGESRMMGQAAPPHSDQGDVEFFIGNSRASL